LGPKPPKLDAKVVLMLTEDRLRALISTCEGPDLRGRARRGDRAPDDRGIRDGEVIALELADVDLKIGAVTVK
jgi:hypothetical protein